jgi:hypothetical protein
MSDPKALEAAHRVRNCDYGLVDEDDARLVACSLLAGEGPGWAEAIEAAAKVADMRCERYRRVSKGGYSDSYKDAMSMLSEEFAEHAAEVRALHPSVAEPDAPKQEKT